MHAAPLPIKDQLLRALNPGDRDLILVPRGTVVAAQQRISELEHQLSQARGTLAMTNPASRLMVGDTALVTYRDEAHPKREGTVTMIGRDDDGIYAELTYADESTEDFDPEQLARVA